MKKHISILNMCKLFIFIIISFLLFTNNSFAQVDTCQTVTPDTDFLEGLDIYNYVQNYNTKTFSIYLHKIRNSTGHGGITDQQIDSWLNVLGNDFSIGGIYFEEVGRDNINSDTYYYYSDNQFGNLIQEYAHSNAIDIYFLSNATNAAFIAARAAWIPSTALVIGMNYIDTHILSHEIGHCLGLYHTHEWRFGKDYDGTYCDIKGDKICDTWPDANLSNSSVVIQNCAIIQYPDPPWECCPPVENIMSYAPPICMDWFTTGQYNRMHTVIVNALELQNTYFHIQAPANLTWANVSGHPRLAWNSVDDPNLNSYKIYRNLSGCGPDCGSFTFIASVNSSTTVYHDTEIDIGNPKFASNHAYYYVTAVNNQSYESFPSNIIDVPTDQMYKRTVQPKIISKFKLLGNFPNPFNSETKILFSLKYSSSVSMQIYNTAGILVQKMDLGKISEGFHEYKFDGTGFSSGVYYYKLVADKFSDYGKFIYQK